MYAYVVGLISKVKCTVQSASGNTLYVSMTQSVTFPNMVTVYKKEALHVKLTIVPNLFVE